MHFVGHINLPHTIYIWENVLEYAFKKIQYSSDSIYFKENKFQ